MEVRAGTHVLAAHLVIAVVDTDTAGLRRSTAAQVELLEAPIHVRLASALVGLLAMPDVCPQQVALSIQRLPAQPHQPFPAQQEMPSGSRQIALAEVRRDTLVSEVRSVIAVVGMDTAGLLHSIAARVGLEAQTPAMPWPEPVGLPTTQDAFHQRAVLSIQRQ